MTTRGTRRIQGGFWAIAADLWWVLERDLGFSWCFWVQNVVNCGNLVDSVWCFGGAFRRDVAGNRGDGGFDSPHFLGAPPGGLRVWGFFALFCWI